MNYKIPFFGIDRFYKKHEQTIQGIMHQVFSGGQVLMGKEIELFEKNMCSLTGRKFAVAVNSCTDALYLALISAGIKPGDEVITTGYSFIASATPILRASAIPVFTDIDPETYMLDCTKAEKNITEKTKAIIAVSLYGQALPMQQLEELADKHKLILIEDAAQSLGSYSHKRKSGSLGKISCISFDPTKIIGAFGTAGILLTDDKKIYDNVQALRYHGKNKSSGKFEYLGLNSQISSFEAALLNFQIEKISDLISERNNIAKKYYNAFASIPEIKLPEILKDHNHIYHKFVIQTEPRDELKKHLETKGIATMIHYTEGIFEQPVFKNYVKDKNSFTNINTVKYKVLSLPLYPELTGEETDYICKTISDFFANKSTINRKQETEN